jgi:hydrogenase nickel incorporation protein HypB
MCVVCGCNDPNGQLPAGSQRLAIDPPPAAVDWTAGGAAIHPETGDLHYGAGLARVSVPGMSPQRAIKLETDVLGENNRIAAHNRAHFHAHGVTALNLVSSPGSGKTTLLCATIEALHRRMPGLPIAVIEGDQQTSVDADRIRATGAPAIQVNTGKGCHLDAPMVREAFARLPLHGHAGDHDAAHAHQAGDDDDHGSAHGHPHRHVHSHPHRHDDGHDDGHDHGHGHESGDGTDAAPGHEHTHAHAHQHDHAHDHHHAHGGPSPDAAPAAAHDHGHGHVDKLLFIENVGNLVCPAMWDLGEAAKVAILSVTEGEDKPLKYPDMFAAAELMVLNKIDLLPHLRFDVQRCIDNARRVNPGIEVLQVSATTGEGMDAWIDWLMHCTPDGPARHPTASAATAASATEAALRQRIAVLEAQLAAARAPSQA